MLAVPKCSVSAYYNTYHSSLHSIFVCECVR